MLCLYHEIMDRDIMESHRYSAKLFDDLNNEIDFGYFTDLNHVAEWAHKHGCNKFLREE